MRTDRDRLYVYLVKKKLLTKAVNEMNRSSDHHHPRVVNIFQEWNHYIVVVEHDGYPYREIRWQEEFCLKEKP